VSESDWDRERGRVLDRVMSSHMRQKQIEHQTEAWLRDLLSLNSVVTFTQQGNATTHTQTNLWMSSVTVPVQRLYTMCYHVYTVDDVILVSFRERLPYISGYFRIFCSLSSHLYLYSTLYNTLFQISFIVINRKIMIKKSSMNYCLSIHTIVWAIWILYG